VTANKLLATDRPKALAALEKELRIDPQAIKVMTDANIYTLALTDAVGLGITGMSDWALESKRIQKAVKPADVMAPKLLAEVDPSLVTVKR
jgi:hypothetical protein